MIVGKNKEEFPLGIKYWCSLTDDVPKLEVYVCIGQLHNPDFWAFKSMKSNQLVSKSFDDLIESKNFKPFLIDLVRLRKEYGAI